MKKQKDGFQGERALTLPAPLVTEYQKDRLYATLYITDIGYYPHAVHHHRERPMPIAQYIFIYCVEGSGWFTVHQKNYRVEENQFFILPAGVPHAYGSDEESPWTIYWIHFGGSLADSYSEGLHEPKTVSPHVHSRISDRIALFEEIFQTLEWGYSRENLLYSSSVFHYFLASLRYLRQFRGKRLLEVEQYDIVDAAIHYMKENMERRVTVQEISTHVGYSSSHFVALFQARTGHSPIAYFNQLKIQCACQLLDLTDLKINQICYKVGISDSYYFSRLFHRIMGVYPVVYRQQKKG